MDFFYAATTITIGDGHIASFWHAPWIEGRKPKDIAPSIFAISERKNFTVSKGIHQDFWISKINTNVGIMVNHLSEFVELWRRVSEVHLVEGTPDDIAWKLTTSGCYTTASAYKAQFEGMVFSFMPGAVWKNSAPPKCKLFAWLILQDHVWIADRLQRRGWTNCGACQLCKREPESAAHLLFKCRYSVRIWNSIISWLGLIDVDTSLWSNFEMVKDWWLSFIYPNGTRRKSFASLVMLTSWKIWNERNARVFRNVASMPSVIVNKIKGEAVIWWTAGAKHLGSIIPRE
jgi:hypothetical protein